MWVNISCGLLFQIKQVFLIKFIIINKENPTPLPNTKLTP